MTAAEAALLAAYRALDDNQQEQLTAWARYLADHYPAGSSPVPIEQGRRNDDDE